MNGVNLIPARRLAAARAAARLRAWLLGAGAYAAIATVAGVALRLPVGADEEMLNFSISAADQRFEMSRKEMESLSVQIDRLRREIETHSLVAVHPDWSILLALLESERRDKVILESCEVEPIAPSDEKRSPLLTPPEQAAFRLRLTGLTLEQGDATEYAEALDNSGLFSKVEILHTTARTQGESRRIAFALDCTLAPLPVKGGDQ